MSFTKSTTRMEDIAKNIMDVKEFIKEHPQLYAKYIYFQNVIFMSTKFFQIFYAQGG